MAMLADARNFLSGVIVSRRLRCRSSLVSPAALPPATAAHSSRPWDRSMLAILLRDAHRSATARPPAAHAAGSPSAARIGTQEVAGVERDKPPERGQCRLLDRDSLPEFECNQNLPGPRHPSGPSLMTSGATRCCRARSLPRLSRAGPLMTGYSRTGCLLSQCPRLRLRREKFGITKNRKL